MSESRPYNVGEGSPEYVALKLFSVIAQAEDKIVYPLSAGGGEKPARKWILDTYAECLDAAKGRRSGRAS